MARQVQVLFQFAHPGWAVPEGAACELRVVGSSPTLGGWDPFKAPKLHGARLPPAPPLLFDGMWRREETYSAQVPTHPSSRAAGLLQETGALAAVPWDSPASNNVK